MPRAFSFSSRFEPRNLSGPFWRAHSPSRGMNPGSITSAGVGVPLPTRLYQTIAPPVRTAPAGPAVNLHHVQNEQSRRRTLERDRLEFGLRRRFYGGPIVEDIGGRRRHKAIK